MKIMQLAIKQEGMYTYIYRNEVNYNPGSFSKKHFILITDLLRCSWQFCGLPPSILCIETSLNAGISAPISLYNAVERGQKRSVSSPLNSSQTPFPSCFHVLLHSWWHKSPGKRAPAAERTVFSPPGGPRCVSSASDLILAKRERLSPLTPCLLFCTVAGTDPWPLHMIVLYQQPYPLEHGFGRLWWIAWKMILISLCHLNFRTKGIISFAARFDLIPFKLYFSCAAGPFFYQSITCHQFECDLVGSQRSGNHHFPSTPFFFSPFI